MAQPKPTTLAQLRRSRELVALSPSGHYFKIRPLNLEQYALSGGLPSQLRALALQGAAGINQLFAGDDGELSAKGESLREFLDGIVKKMVVEPNLHNADLEEDLLPVDYRWLVNIALGEEDRDGEGRLLWGREPLSRWATFRDEHDCPEDCEGCQRVRDRLSLAGAYA